MIIIGSSADVRSVDPSTSRAAFGGDGRDAEVLSTFSASHSPAWLRTRRYRSVGICAAASSAIGFIWQNFPRRYVPAAVTSAFASASLSRETIADAPNP